MTEKAVVTKEQAEALEIVMAGADISDIFKVHVDDGWYRSEFIPLNELSTEELAKALVNGYEVEKSPEERLIDYYEYLKDAEDSVERYGGSGAQFRQGWQSVSETLDILGIKIEGIND